MTLRQIFDFEKPIFRAHFLLINSFDKYLIDIFYIYIFYEKKLWGFSDFCPNFYNEVGNTAYANAKMRIANL